MRPRKPERKKKERREWKEGIERKKERKKEGVCFLMQNDSDFKMITLTLIFFILNHYYDFFYLFIFFSVFHFIFVLFCFFWRSFHQTVSATPALSSLILRQWNQKNVTKAPQDIIICKKSLFITAVDLSMKVAMEKEKDKKN